MLNWQMQIEIIPQNIFSCKHAFWRFLVQLFVFLACKGKSLSVWSVVLALSQDQDTRGLVWRAYLESRF